MAAVAQAQPAPATVGLIYPVKTLLGQQGKRGSELAVERLNASGGVAGGQPLKLVVYDDNYQPADGVAAARRLASEDKVSIVAGTINSAVAMGVAQVARQNNMLFIAPITKSPQVTEYDRAFRFNPLVATEGAVFNQYLKDKIRPARVAVVVENGDYGRSIIADMKQSFGDKVVAAELYEILKQTDFSTLASRVKASNPDVVCLAFSSIEQGGNLLRTLKESGIGAKRCILPGSVTPALLQVAGASAEGAFTMDVWAPSVVNDANRAFVAAFQAKYNELPSKVDFLAYESIWVLGQAMRKAGTATDTGRIAATLRAGTWESPRGALRFVDNQAVAAGFVNLVVKDGRIVVVD